MRMLALLLTFSLGALAWQKGLITEKRSFGSVDVVSTAQYYCDQLSKDGYSNWRLPTARELVVLAGSHVEPAGLYWSLEASKTKHEAIAVDIITGLLYSKPISERHWVYCVR